MNQLATTQESPIATASAAMMMNPAHMQSLVGFAEMMAKSALTVPDHLRGKPSDCLAIAMQAAQWGMNPFAVAQKTHVVSGRLGYEAQLVNAVVQASGAIVGAFSYEYRGAGADLECRVGAVLRGTHEITWGEWLRNGDVTTRNSPLWKVNPKQQLGYLQVKNWARSYCPGSILGVYTDDELQDVAPPVRTQADPAPRNVHMGAADVVEPVNKRQAYAEDKFTENLPKWRKLIDAGKKTAEEIIKTVETTALLSDEQKAQIRAPGKAKTAEKHPLEIEMDAATDLDSLNLLADRMRGEQDEELFAHLTNVYQANLDRLSNKE